MSDKIPFSFRSHLWGHDDTFFEVNKDQIIELKGNRYEFSGLTYPKFIPYIKEVLGVDITKVQPLSPQAEHLITEPIENKPFIEAISKNLKVDQLTNEAMIRLKNSHGQTTCFEVYKIVYYGKQARLVDLVVYPETEEDASLIIAQAKTHNVCIVPYGGGTNVTSALLLPENEKRMIVSLDMERLNKVLWINEENQTACIQAGIKGLDLEDQLNAKGYILGHQPDSVEFSTLGGWISTNASGMKKNKYGNIDDIVETVYMITPNGILEQREGICRTSMGIKPQSSIFGSEGNLGLITKAVVKIHKKPELTQYESLIFKDFDTGISFIKTLSKTNYIPASMRLVDNFQLGFGQVFKEESKGFKKLMSNLMIWVLKNVKGFDLKQIALSTIVMEGSREEVAYQQKQLKRLAKQYGAVAAGGKNGKGGYNLTFMIAYIRDFLFEYHIIGDTLETSVPYDKIKPMIKAVEECYHKEYKALGIKANPYISYRIPQIYHTGVCIYFMFGIYTEGISHPEDVFSDLEHKIRATIVENGGSISHHHGVGKLRKDFLPMITSRQSRDLVRGIKKATDPTNVFGIGNNVFALEE
ncbi:MAG: alkyldihydroxyacetonephosphate synthase [Cyclobacteriaceae bacterium]|jgi:alkyldihydroxyacetonephosphate synthase